MSERLALAGVAGDPVAHSLSPAIHGHWLARYGVAGHYVPLRVAAADLREVLAALPKMGFRGINVTVPHKEQALRLADAVTDQAALIGAANTLTFTAQGTVSADNTDAGGFVDSLRAAVPGWQPRQGSAVVLGAGGAARAVTAGLLQAGVPRIVVFNRTRTRAVAMAEHFGGRVSALDWTQMAEPLEEADLLVNATSLGMEGQPDLQIDLAPMRPGAIVADIVYAPAQTGLLRQAQARGLTPVGGLGMLLHQAVPGFHRWFGVRPEVDQDLIDAITL